MNRFYTYILFGILLFVVGCVDTPAPECFKPTTDSHYLEVDKTELNFESAESVNSLSLRSSQNWYFSEYASWLDVSDINGFGDARVDIVASENFSADTVRTNIFNLTTEDEGWYHSKQIGAVQAAAVPYIDFGQGELVISGAASTNRLNISSNTLWTATCNADWLTISPADDNSYIDITVSENLSSEERVATIVFTGAITKTFKVTQNVVVITINNHTLEYPQSGGAYKLKITSEVAWNVVSNDWIEVTPSSGGAGEHEITIAVLPNWGTNNRVSTVKFDIGDYIPNYVIIKQDGIILATEENLTFKALGDTKTIHVESNIEWNVLSKPSWIEISPSSTKGSSTVTVTADNNSDAVNRSGSIVLGIEGVTHTAEINVSQDGKHFAINNESLAFKSTGGVMELTMFTNDSWYITLNNNSEWINLSQDSGEETVMVNIAAIDNPSVNPRSDIARVIPMDCPSVDVVIRQEARYITINTNGVQFFSKGGTSDAILVSTDGEFVITEDVDWLSFVQDRNLFYITAETNETGHIRTGVITLQLTDLVEGSMSLQLIVTQIAPGGVFGKDDYAADDMWDASYDGIFNIKVLDYISDENWDEKGNHGINLNIEGYIGDSNWDGNFGNADMDKNDYPTDDDYNANNGNENSNVDKDDFHNDENYDNDKIENN